MTVPPLTRLRMCGSANLCLALSGYSLLRSIRYAATGVVCYDLENERWLWQVHLDLSTSWSNRPSRLYAAPTVADLDADGQREVVVATMAGNLFAILPDGSVKTGFPVEVWPPVPAR